MVDGYTRHFDPISSSANLWIVPLPVGVEVWAGQFDRCNRDGRDTFGSYELLSFPVVVTSLPSRNESFFYRTLFLPTVHEAVSAIFH